MLPVTAKAPESRRRSKPVWRWVVLCLIFAPVTARAAEYPGVVPVSGQIPTALIELDGTPSEAHDGGQLSYKWTQIDGPRVELSDPSAAKPYFRTGTPGLYRFQLVVTANGLDSEPFVVEIMIERDNLPPVAKIDPEVFGEVDKEMVIDGTASFDLEGEALIYRWRLLSGGNLDIPPAELSKPVITFVPKQDGVFELELVVSDGKDVSPPVLTRLYIKPRPLPPVARARAVPREIPTAPPPEAEAAMAPPEGVKPVARIQGPAVAMVGEKVMLDARGSGGSQAARLKYFWRQKSGPFVNDYEVVYDGAAQRFDPPRAGDYEFELRVSDGRLESDPNVHSLKVVNEPEPPVAVVEAPTRAMPGALVKMDATRSFDLEGSKLTYHWRQTGGPKVTRYLMDESLGDAAPAFHPPQDGLYSFELVVSNERGMRSRPVEIEIEVGAARRPLSIAIAGPQVTKTNERFVLEAVVENEPREDLTFLWRQSDGPGRVLDQVEGRSLGLVITLPGRYVFDLTALDRAGVRGTSHQVIEVFGTPGAPQPPPERQLQHQSGVIRPPPLPTTPTAPTRPVQPLPRAHAETRQTPAPRTDIEPLAPLPTMPQSGTAGALGPLVPIPGAVQPAPDIPASHLRPPPVTPVAPGTAPTEMPVLEPIAAMPQPLSPAPPAQPRVVGEAPRRPAAQIHPETRGGEPAPVLMPPLL
ncbi:MAG: hypothetical protein LBJ46_00660 [Planctomycetota bacterium]|jgi:hypothetical protein|nr:hypothetical protein [Planctomycetota bacterium]